MPGRPGWHARALSYGGAQVNILVKMFHWSNSHNLFCASKTFGSPRCANQHDLRTPPKENVDGEALEWALSRAATDSEPAALVMVSDGTPRCDSTLKVNTPHILEDHLDDVLDRAIKAGVAVQRVRMGSDWDKTGITLRDGIDTAVSGVDVRDWSLNLRSAISNRERMPPDTPLERLRMGGGEEVPMNPLNDALAHAVAEASNRLSAENKNAFGI